MSSSLDFQQHIADILGSGLLSVPVPIVARKPKEMASRILEAVAKHELCITILPPLPTEVEEGYELLIVRAAEFRIRLTEQPAKNQKGIDIYELMDEVLDGLHWQPLKGIAAAVKARMEEAEEDEATAQLWAKEQPSLAPFFALGAMLEHPLYAAARPTDTADNATHRVIDCIFKAPYTRAAQPNQT